MLTIVCVYNKEKILSDVLLKSLKGQTAEYELILLDNRDNRFKSAAEALNYGGAKAKCDYIMFVHQDMWLGSNTWLADVEEMLRSIPHLGVAGVAGMSEEDKNVYERGRWSIEDFGDLWRWGPPVSKPEEVQTLDECLMLVPRAVFDKLQFDEKTFDGWDCYGADYCLCVRRLGLKALGLQEGDTQPDLRSIDFRKTESTIVSLAFNKRLYRTILVPLAKLQMKRVGIEGHLEQMEAVVGHSTADRLNTVKAQTLVLTGTEDKIVNPKSSEEIAGKIPNAQLVELEGGSHAFFFEMRKEFNQAILDFLRDS